MVSKKFGFGNVTVEIIDPHDIVFDHAFVREVYEWVFDNIKEGEYEPQIDVDLLHSGHLGFSIHKCAVRHNFAVPPSSKKVSNAERASTQRCVRAVLELHPQLAGLFSNTISSAAIAIRNAEFLLGQTCDGDNFIHLKKIIDVINRSTWNREQDVSERQSGVSVLGGISETLLNTVMLSLIDDEAFFKIGNPKVQSYGDFVVVCLPNNLWISVKSNFARERLLASGYSNDILGAGFFEDSSEFTQPVRIRNFQRAGFLAMYCPDVAVTPNQMHNETSTYQEIEHFHLNNGTQMPLNINGKPFIRKLSSLSNDIAALLSQGDIKKRFTVDF